MGFLQTLLPKIIIHMLVMDEFQHECYHVAYHPTEKNQAAFACNHSTLMLTNYREIYPEKSTYLSTPEENNKRVGYTPDGKSLFVVGNKGTL